MEPEQRRRICAEIAVHLRRMTVVTDHAVVRHAPPELTSNSAVAVLTALADRGAQRPRDLLASVPITSGGLSKVLDRLELLGWVERRLPVDAVDGRAITVHLSARGRRQWTRLQQAALDAMLSSAAEAKEIIRLCEEYGVDTSTGASPAVHPLGFGSRVGIGLAEIIETRAGVPLEVNDFVVLALAFTEGPVRPRSIIDTVGLTSGGATKLVDRLVAAGLLSRTFGAVDDDHRAVLVGITRRGERALIPVLDGIDPYVGAIHRLMYSLATASAA